MHSFAKTVAFTMAYAVVASIASAQALPTAQPGMITIVREQVKVGHNADHEKVEASYAAASEKAKVPEFYLALNSMTGPNEAVFISPFASHTALGEAMKRDGGNAPLQAEFSRLSKLDADHINGFTVMQAVARPDLSHGAFPDFAMVRFQEITTYRVRIGHEAEFEAAAKAYISAANRAASHDAFRLYQVVAGMVSPSYLLLRSHEKFAEFDQSGPTRDAVFAAMNSEERAAWAAGPNAINNYDTQRYSVSPTMTYTNKDARAKDPAFWNPKKAAITAP